MIVIVKASDNFNHSQNSRKLTKAPTFRYTLPKVEEAGANDEPVDYHQAQVRKDFIEVLLILSFRKPPAHDPGQVVTRKRRNKMMKAYNGNRRKRQKEPRLAAAAPPFNVIHQNIPGKKEDDQIGTSIDTLLKRFHPAILVITECDPDKVEKHVPPDYTFLRGTSSVGWCRVSMLIKVTQTYEVLELNLEVPTVAIKVGGWTFMGVYGEWAAGGRKESHGDRPAELARLKSLVKYWKTLTRGKALVLGDLNFDPDPDFPTGHQQSLKHIRDLIETNIVDRGWNQLITGITRSVDYQTPACLDHVYVSREDFVEHVFHEPVASSDHYAVGVKVRLQRPIFIATSFWCRNIKKIPKGEFERVFTTSRIYEVYGAGDVHEALGCLEFKIVRALNIVAPLVRIQTREHYAKWLTPDLQARVKRRNLLRHKAENSKLSADWREFKVYQKALNKDMKVARDTSLKEDMDVKDSKLRWKRVKAWARMDTGSKEQDIKLKVEGAEIVEPWLVAHHLNSYFKEKVVKLREDLDVSVEASLSYTDEYLNNRDVPKVEFRQVSTRYIKKIIMGLKNTGAIGRDGISTEVLKKFRHVLAGPIRHIVNMSIFFAEYPNGWKVGHISPLPKGGDSTNPKNWRPICINPAMSKVLEMVLNNQISSHMERTGLYSQTQHAYRKVRSVTTALLELDTMVRSKMNEGKTVAILTTDISAGFNLVSKEILVPKMSRFGFGEKSCDLLRNYLTGRRTRTKVKNIMSSEIELETGVGEGSVLGPNFFSCGMTDVSVVAKRVMRKIREVDGKEVWCSQIEYADDCTPVIAADDERSLQLGINEMLEGCSQFYSSNGLKLNEGKCHILVFRPHWKVSDLHVAGKPEEQSVRLLGLFIDNKLNYKVHAGIVCGRIVGKLKALEKIKHKASFKTMKEVTESLVLSTIDFCSELYLRVPENQSNVQKKLNSAMRLCLDYESDYSVRMMLYELSWLNTTNMWRWGSIRTLKRILKDPEQVPFLWQNVDIARGDHHEVRYRALGFKVKKKTRHIRESYLWSATNVYNDLGLHGRFFADYEEFREQVKDMIRLRYGNRNV